MKCMLSASQIKPHEKRDRYSPYSKVFVIYLVSTPPLSKGALVCVLSMHQIMATKVIRKSKPPKTMRHQMSDVEKGMILGLFYTFGVVSVVARMVKRPWSMVKSYLDRTWLRGDTKNPSRSGRPEKLNR